MTSIADAVPGGWEPRPWDFYLAVLGEQARIALRHLLNVWQIEGNPPSTEAWRAPSLDVEGVWADLQGALFAGIVVSRMLRPVARGSREAADARATTLRDLLDVPPDAAILSLADVRDPLEHLDERIDGELARGDVWSFSDFHLALGGQLRTGASIEGEPGREFEGRHVLLRQFAPELGVLYFGEHALDLFALEADLHSILATLPRAYEKAKPTEPRSGMLFGSARVSKWDPQLARDRRTAIDDVRARVRREGVWMLRPSGRPRTVVFVETLEPDSSEPPE